MSLASGFLHPGSLFGQVAHVHSGLLQLIVVLALAGFASASSHAQTAPQLVAITDHVEILEDDAIRTRSWRLNPALDPDVLRVQLQANEERRVCFLSGVNAFCSMIRAGDVVDFVIEYDAVSYPTRIVGVPPAAAFDDAYQNRHRGQITVLIPDVYELVNIAIALTPYAQASSDLVYTNTDYHRDVMAYFRDVRDHPFVQWLYAEMNRDRFTYFRHKMSSYSFEFDDTGSVIQSPIYNSTNFRGEPNTLLPALDLMQSFAQASRFQTFYSRNQRVYDGQVSFLTDSLKTSRMLDWLEENFPGQSRYDHVKVVFSPLVYRHQSITWFETEGFNELQPHINFPYPPADSRGFSAAATTLRRGNLLFTEINHGFINPAAEPFEDQINAALTNRERWARSGSGADNYASAVSLFLELMNWGLIELYYVDVAPEAELDRLLKANRDYMSDSRGFTMYPKFAEQLVMLYRSRPEGTTIKDLYPQIIEWIAVQDS